MDPAHSGLPTHYLPYHNSLNCNCYRRDLYSVVLSYGGQDLLYIFPQYVYSVPSQTHKTTPCATVATYIYYSHVK